MSPGTSVAEMKQEEKEEEEQKEEEGKEQKGEEEEGQGEVEMVMSQGASDLLHKPSFLSAALKLSAAITQFDF